MKCKIVLDPGRSPESSMSVLSTFTPVITRLYTEIVNALKDGDPSTVDSRKALLESGPISFAIKCYRVTSPSTHIATLTVSLNNPNPRSCLELDAEIHLFGDGSMAGGGGVENIEGLIQFVLRELITDITGDDNAEE